MLHSLCRGLRNQRDRYDADLSKRLFNQARIVSDHKTISCWIVLWSTRGRTHRSPIGNIVFERHLLSTAKQRSFSSILLLNCCSATSCVIACCSLATVFKQTNSIGNRDKFVRNYEIGGNQNRPDQGNRKREKRWERKPNMDNINAVMESCTMQRETNTSISHRRHTKREKPFKSACGRTSTKLIVRYKSHAPYCFGNMQGLNSMNDIHLISIILR